MANRYQDISLTAFLYVGDDITVAYGNRYASDQFEATVLFGAFAASTQLSTWALLGNVHVRAEDRFIHSSEAINAGMFRFDDVST